ncbi:peptide/nickel transport system substrate-binding protein [Micromonospora rhizosphaerae]|uniref:Peptide/nickel transport system substrate-binding protein n=2 Tax=Micromonospora rhizosphaerae TaxID=568872 RepID=A0A1C6T3Q6_9ACTN|nr:peptide/nickel transport system substrate-binding protein [Micromonospora rhizosphaerae]
MTISRANDPTSLDPAQQVSTGGGLETLTAFYDRLADLDASGKIHPSLATEWKVSDDGLTYTFKLRDGVMFHDGSPFTADEVRFTWQRIVAMKAPAAQYWSNVKEVAVVDPRTVAFHLKQASPTFLPTLAGQRGVYMGPSKACVEANEKTKGDWAAAYFTDHECGTGPYKLDTWQHNQQITFNAYEKYWRGWDGKHVQRFVQKIIKEPSTAQLLLTQGQLDLAADSLPIQVYQQLKHGEGVTVDSASTTTIDQIVFNLDKGPMKDPRVREAIALLFDYKAAIEQAYAGEADRVFGPIPNTVWPKIPDQAKRFDRNVEPAKRLLAEAGYPDGFTLQFDIADLNQWRNLALILESSLAEAHITVKTNISTWPVLFAKLSKPKGEKPFDMAGFQMWAAIPDPSDILMWWNTDATTVINPGWGDAKTDALIDGAQTETDQAQRSTMYEQLITTMNADVPAIWIDQPKALTAMRKDVHGFVYNPYYNGLLDFYALSKS